MTSMFLLLALPPDSYLCLIRSCSDLWMNGMLHVRKGKETSSRDKKAGLKSARSTPKAQNSRRVI